MKKGCTIAVLIFLAIAFAGALVWLYQNAQPRWFMKRNRQK